MPSIKEQPKPQVRLRLLQGATYAIWKGYTLSGWGYPSFFFFNGLNTERYTTNRNMSIVQRF